MSTKLGEVQNYPVERVSWYDVQEYIRYLNDRTGKNYRLPTEAEWEYACRAGTTGDRYGNLADIAWYDSSSGDTTHPVGQKQANAWGLYDMLGNVCEWCQDWFDTYTGDFIRNPVGPTNGSSRVFRGGSWLYGRGVRAPLRAGLDPSKKSLDLGFRLARDK